ncbi:hypothetical protein, conserved [Babesia bigemina]|uniref:Uncharacterized protein n=1 Tax=Babesia bigemina TaxID=5866 RepID=A0A061D8B7_BABBI|nr:hypothetical protein, conserved [Babesia bigemina]CDR96222.1 hypothetical protein, conserved [Babesia bigemina]|eukprot:XP_012768408.1 hypothetical protein, conserved [Babesia bigemina]
MESLLFLRVVLLLGCLTKTCSALNVLGIGKTTYSGLLFHNAYTNNLSSERVTAHRIRCRTSISKPNYRCERIGFIYDTATPAWRCRNVRHYRLSVSDRAKNVDEIFDTLCESLKSKSTSFVDLKNRLNTAGVSLEGCNTPEDVVRRVAQLEVYGKEYVDDEMLKSSPTFQALLNEILTETMATYKSKRGREKTQFIQQLKGLLTSKNVCIANNITDEDIIRLASEQESRERMSAQLPHTKPCNEMSQRIDSYRDEADSIFAVYRNIKDDKLRKSFLSQVKDELNALSVDHKDCETPEEMINRLAYGRVFPQEKDYEAESHKRTAEHALLPWPNATVDDIYQFSAILGDGHGIFGVNGGIIDNFAGMSDMLEEDGLFAGSFSLLKDLAKMFGVNIGSSEKKRIVFENQDTAPNSPLAESSDDPSLDESEFNADELQPVFAKVKQTTDKNLLEMFKKSVKEATLRKALQLAHSSGYDTAREAYATNKMALYILDKFKERGIFE